MPRRRLLAFLVLLPCFTLPTLLTAQSALQFVSVTPCRVVDTRRPDGPFGGPSLGSNGARDFTIPEGACNIPANAAAYALNVTVVPQHSLGYLTIWPTGQPKPVISTLNSLDGRIKANAAIVPAGLGGVISVFVTDASNVILDINGYFVPGTNTTLAFFPVTPCRVADTRWTNGSLGGPFLSGGVERSFPILTSACNLPISATAYSLNVTAVPRHDSVSYVTVWPAGGARPIVSTLNAPTGAVTANAAIMPAGVQGAVTVYPTNDTDLVIDIDGYFALSASGPGPLSLYTLGPCRVLDTRPPHGNGTFSGLIPVGVLQSPCNVPSAQAYVLNATVIPQNNGFYGYLTLWPDTEGQPLVSTLNALDGMITSNMAIVPTLNGNVDAFASNQGNLVLDIFSYFAPISQLTMTTTSLPSATLNYNYAATMSAAGGVMPYTWSVSSGSLPQGLNLDPASGLIFGIPTAAGPSQFNVQVADSESPAQAVAAQFDLQVNASITQLSIVTTALPSGTQNAAYSSMLAATGGITPYTWSIVAGALPPGLRLNTSTGAITGTPSGAGVSNFTVQAADSEGPQLTASKQLSITVSPAVPLQITTSSLPNGVTGTHYNAPVNAIGGVYPYTWGSSGSLPGGLTLNLSTGVISGTPTSAGTANFTIDVTDSETPAVNTTKQLSITIAPSGGGNPGLLTGNYAFYLKSFNASGPFTLAGSFISDGAGHITSGVVDGNALSGQPFTSNVTGTYSIFTTGLNLITLQGPSYGPATFAFVLSSSGNGRFMEYDDPTGHGNRGSGVLRKASPAAFSLGSLNSNWVLGMAGFDDQGKRLVDVGRFSLASGDISDGVCAINDNGEFQTCTFVGNVGAINAQTGRGVSTTQSDNGTSHQAIYVVSAGELLMEQIDSVPNTHQPLLVGSVEQQSGTFNNGSLNGTAVAYMQDIHGSDGVDQSGVIIFSFDANGHGTTIAADEDKAGTITQDLPWQATCSVQSNGAFNLGAGNPTGFLISHNQGLFVGTGSNSILGWIEAQSGGPFSNASIAGTYIAGSLAPLDYSNGRNEIFAGAGDGAGNMVFDGDSSSANGLGQYFGTNVTFILAANGRGTALAQGDHVESVVYMISPAKFVVLMPAPDAEIVVFEH